MINERSSSLDPRNTHTIQEFIEASNQASDYYGYSATSYIQRLDNMEYIVKNIVDDHLSYLMNLARNVTLTNPQVLEYRYNPKKLSNKIYKTTRLWHIILKINGLANVHEFSLTSHNVKLVHPQDLSSFISKVYNSEHSSIVEFNNSHEDLTTSITISKYIPLDEESRRYM